MNYLKSFRLFEISTDKSYLGAAKVRAKNTYSNSGDISLAKKLYGKIFAQAYVTSDKDWGIEFKLKERYGSTDYYQVVFRDEFFKNFIKKNADESWWKKFLSIFGIGEVNFKLLKDCIIQCEVENFNRIHFSKGISEQFRGIGLGYVIYEAFIKFLGYGSSNLSASFESQKIWSEIASDPDFYCIGTSFSIFAVHKDCKDDLTETIYEWMKHQNKYTMYGDTFEIDDKLFQKYNKLEQKYKNVLEIQKSRLKLKI